MTIYVDTSILLPAMVAGHPRHRECLALLETAYADAHHLLTATHTSAELYTNLTKLPHDLNILPTEARQAIQDRLGAIFTFIPLTEADYQAALARCAERNLISGVIYDALHLQAAIKAEAKALYTANLRDFERLRAREVLELRGG